MKILAQILLTNLSHLCLQVENNSDLIQLWPLSICLFEMDHLNDLLFDEWVANFVKEVNVEEALKSSILVVQKATAVPPNWSFLNGLLNHVVKEVLKSSIFVVQKACQGSYGSIV